MTPPRHILHAVKAEFGEPRYRAVTARNFRQVPELAAFSESELFEMEVVASVFPFRTNNYVIDELIDWDNIPADPVFRLTFPQRGMLTDAHFDEMARLMRADASKDEIKGAADRIRGELNPHPAGQVEKNVPLFEGERLTGVQHKYGETALFFPSSGQSCHAYCTFCFRWPQFVGMDGMKFALADADRLVRYLKEHGEVTDILITGGDPMVMSAKKLGVYIDALLAADLPNLASIRIGTKSLSFWPYRFLTDDDSEDILKLFRKVVRSGRHLALMAHFSHTAELTTDAVKAAMARILETGANIRTQSPVLAGINDSAEVWGEMWREQVRLGAVPYYMFMVRDTGAQHHFGVPLVKASEIFAAAYKTVSGIGRTVKGPVMSAGPGKVHMLGTAELCGEKVFALQLVQGREQDWVLKPFFAAYNEDALWLDDLKPAFGEERFFFE